ncbi:MAG: Very short patch repair protein [Candidatus Dichloromethanomonas elyunquensis]|nr:MAG: Very short patch repair protein [Candidatus Dichloromethanomonas elyunquensis]
MDSDIVNKPQDERKENKGMNHMDPLTSEQRRKNMQAIKSKDTSIEITLRKALWKHGVRYRKNYKNLQGKPDIAITKYKIAIFCDSEFWHGFNWSEKKARITTNRQFWIDKIENNMRRDNEINKALLASGWMVLRFWGKEINKDLNHCIEIIMAEIEKMRGDANGKVF